MDVIQTLKVKNLNGTFEQTVPIGTSSIYVYRKNNSGQTIETVENALQEIENDIATINGDASTKNSIDWKIKNLETKLDSNDSSNPYNTFEKVQNKFNLLDDNKTTVGSIDYKVNAAVEMLRDEEPEDGYINFYKVGESLRHLNGPVSTEGSVAHQIDQLHKTILNDEKTYETLKSVGDRLRFLEGSEEGSIKNQIATAKSEILGGAGADYDTLKEIQSLFEELKTGEKDAFDTLGEIATGIENNKKAIESNDTDIANLDNKIDTSITNLIDNAGEGYKTLGDIETSVKSINSTINGQISDLDSDMSTLNSTINNRIDGVEQNVSNKDTEINNRIDALIGTLPQGAQYSTIEAINTNLTTLNGTGTSSINGKINTAINNLIGGASSSLDTLKEIETFLNNLVSNNENGLDSLDELASAYNKLEDTIGELPDNYKNSNLVQYSQDLTKNETNRAKSVEDQLDQNITDLSGKIGILENRIENSTNDALKQEIDSLHGTVASWNGLTEDIEYVMDGDKYFYRISEKVLTAEDLVKLTIQYRYQGSIITRPTAERDIKEENGYIKIKSGSMTYLLCNERGIFFINDPTNDFYIKRLYRPQYASYNDFKNTTTLSTYTTTSNQSNGVSMTLYSVGHVMQMRITGTLDPTMEFTSYTFSPPEEGSMLVPSYYLVKRVALNARLNATLQITPDGDVSIHNFSASTLNQDIEINETFVLDSQVVFIIEEEVVNPVA